MNTFADSPPLRRLVFALLIVAAAGSAAGRILGVSRVYEPYLTRDESDPDDKRSLWPAKRPTPMPTHDANDRSRWATIRALVDHGTYVIGHRERDLDPATGKPENSGILNENGWGTIDMVLHPETKDFYSSKPPLLPTILAGEYWLLNKSFGWEISDRKDCPWIVRTILFTVNFLPFVLYLILLARLVDRLGITDWGKLFVMTAGCFATFLNPFLITLNNHTIAACSAMFALYPAIMILIPPSPLGGEGRGEGVDGPSGCCLASRYLCAGLFAGFTACNELPAASFTAALFLILLIHSPGRTLAFFVPAAAIPIAAFLWTNYLALGQLSPAYSEFGGTWYNYEGSHWLKKPDEIKRGIDWAKDYEGRGRYAFHVLLGHHGLFSLSPILLMSLSGMLFLPLRRSRSGDSPPAPIIKLIAGMTLLLTAVVIGFYLIKSDNYGGWTCGLRWLMWLTPLWLLTMLPIADRMAGCRGWRVLAYLLLFASVLSVSYPMWNPWRHPWIYDFLDSRTLMYGL